jgi:hypothetical protein
MPSVNTQFEELQIVNGCFVMAVPRRPPPELCTYIRDENPLWMDSDLIPRLCKYQRDETDWYAKRRRKKRWTLCVHVDILGQVWRLCQLILYPFIKIIIKA